MSEKYRTVDSVHLHDTNIELAIGDKGVWNELESPRWEISGVTLRRWLEAMGIDISNVATRGYEVGKRLEPSRVNVEGAYPIYVEQPIRSISRGSHANLVDWQLTAIGVRVVAAHLLDIRLTVKYGNGKTEIREIAYSGGFTILWAETEQ